MFSFFFHSFVSHGLAISLRLPPPHCLIDYHSPQDAIWACYRRSLEMGGEDSNVGPGRVPVPQPPTIVFRPSHHPIEAPRGEIVTEILEHASQKDDGKRDS